jgi:hypothetical protein
MSVLFAFNLLQDVQILPIDGHTRPLSLRRNSHLLDVIAII